MGTRGAARELLLAAAALLLVSRLVDGPVAWAVGLALLGAVAFGTLQVVGESDAPAAATGVPVESLVVPAAAAFAVFGSIRLVPIGLGLAPAMAAGVWLIGRVIATEARMLTSPSGPSGADRTAILVQSLIVGFLGFTGIAVLVPGGLAEPGSTLTPAPSGIQLALLASADAALAFLLGYRAAALRSSNLRDVAWYALTSAIVVAIGAAALRAMEIPRLLGPALLVLVLFLWDAIHGTPPARRRDPRRLWETALLLVLGIVVIAWTVRLRS